MSLFGGPAERRAQAKLLTAAPPPSPLPPAERRQAAIDRAIRAYGLQRHGLVSLGEVRRVVGSGSNADPRREIVAEMFCSGRMNKDFYVRYAHDPDVIHPQFSTEPPPEEEPPAPWPGHGPPPPLYPALAEPAPEPLNTPVSW